MKIHGGLCELFSENLKSMKEQQLLEAYMSYRNNKMSRIEAFKDLLYVRQKWFWIQSKVISIKPIDKL